MLIIKILTLVSLAMIFAQDLMSRSVSWLIFPLLVLLLILPAALIKGYPCFSLQAITINLIFIVGQLFLVSIYFSVKYKNWTNISGGLLGWGDILFLLSISMYLSVLNLLFFYVISLLTILLAWNLIARLPIQRKNEIPLAGLQAVLFGIFLICDWWFRMFNLTDDTWLLNLITK